MRIRSKIGWSFTALAVSLLLTLATVTYLVSRATLKDEAIRHLSSVAAIQEQRIAAFADGHLRQLALVSNRTQVRLTLRELLDGGDRTLGDRLRRLLDDSLTAVSAFERLAVLGPAGNLLCAVERDPPGTHPAPGAALVRSAAAHPVLAGFHLSAPGRLTVRLAGPLVLEGRTLGVLVADVHADGVLDSAGDASGLGATGDTTLAFRDEAGRTVLVLPGRDAAATVVAPADPAPGAPPTPAQAALDGVEGVFEASVDDGTRAVIAVTRHLERFGLGVAVTLDAAEACAPVRRLAIVLVILTLAAAALFVALSQVLARSIARPLQSLTAVAVRISEGDRTARAVGKHDDEVSVLAEAVNRMAQHLMDQNASLEEQVSQRTTELREANRALEAYTASVTHDLRAPLRGIRQWGDSLLEDHGPDLPDEARGYVEHIIVSAMRMNALIEDLLTYSRTSAANLPLAPVSLSSVVADVLEQLQVHLRDRRAQVSVVEPLPTVLAHQGALFHVVENLLTNAAKYVSPGILPRITVRAASSSRRVRVWVEDNGIGIAPDAQARIFEPFERLSTAASTGTGIGLAIVRRSLERMGGSVGVESEPGQGSRFWFELPVAAASPDVAVPPGAAAPDQTRPPRGASAGS